MPPKKTSELPLSEAESLLLKIAARIFTAVKYKERHPNENHTNFQRNMTMEMEHVKKIFADYPQEKRVHCTHGALEAAAWQYQVAKDNDCQPVYDTIMSEITKCIQGANRLWPMVLKSLDLSKEAMAQPPEMCWWLPESDDKEEEDAIGENKGKEEKVEQAKNSAEDVEEDAEEEQEGEIKSCCISKQKTKGKAPIPADSNIGTGHSDPNEDNAINDNKNKKEKDDTTPCDAKHITAKREYHVLVESPPHLRLKHRQRKNEASDAVDIPDDHKNTDNDVLEIPWVGKGKWGALKPSKVCTNCASQRKMEAMKGKTRTRARTMSQWQCHLNIVFLLHPPAPAKDLLKLRLQMQFTNADIHKIKESLQQLMQIVLTMCEQQNINISNADIVGLAPNTPSGLSPLGTFCHLLFGRWSLPGAPRGKSSRHSSNGRSPAA
ncbi:hypothetical protein V8E53_010965 [Lactarius tabidus]